MHVTKTLIAQKRSPTFSLVVLLSSFLLMGLSACGKKGPLYHAPPEVQPDAQSAEQPQNKPEQQKPK